MIPCAPLLLLFAQSLAAVQIQPESRQLEQKLSSTVEEYSLFAESFFQGLHKFASDFKIPMGIEWVRGANTLRSRSLSWRGTTVFEMIRSLVGAYPGYEVEPEDGVLHVFPRGYLGDGRNVLDLRLAAFEARNDLLALASMRLRSMVRLIQQPPPPAPVGAGEARSIVIGAGGDRNVNFRSEDATVRKILNGLTLGAGQTIWVVTYADDPEATPGRFRPTVSLYSRDPVPDEQQPVWVFVPWGLEVSLPGK